MSSAATVAAAAAAIYSVKSPDGQREAESVSSIKESFHIESLLNYLPIIVLVVIILIGIVTSDLLKNNAGIFATLVIAFAWVTLIHYFSPSKFIKLAEEDPAPTLLPKLSNPVDVSNYKIIIFICLLVLGLGLGFGSINVSKSAENYDLSVGMISLGSIMLIVSFFYLLFVAFKYIPALNTNSTIQYFIEKFNVLPLPLIILLIIIGIPLVVRGSEIKNNMNSGKLTEDTYNLNEYKKTIANTGAEWMLGLGITIQIVVFMAFGYYIWNYISTNGFTLKNPILIGIFAFIAAGIFMPGGLFLSKSLGLKGSGFGTDDDNKLIDKEPFEYKAFMVHAIIYFIVGIVFLIIMFGQTEKFTALNLGLVGLTIMLIITFIMVAAFQQAENDKQINIGTITNDKDSVYYKQLRDEAVKELKQKNSNATEADIEAAVSGRLDKLRKESQAPTDAIMWTFMVISLIIVVFIVAFWVRRISLIKGNSPDISVDIKAKIKDDKMLSDDWDKLLTDHANESLIIRFAKWFSLVPFLSVILLILWVSILFTNVTTSPTTTNWIGKTFSGDMFPRVKELIDAFFIVIIAGLSLCAILLLPIVKEMNVGGLESILKFAESVQVWQFNKNDSNPIRGKWVGLLIFLAVFFAGLSWWWHYLNVKKPEEEKTTGVSLPIIPENWGWAIGFVVLLAICSIPTGYHIFSDGIDNDFAKENVLKRILRQILTTIYLVPWLIIVLFRAGLYSIASLSGIPEIVKKRDETLDLLKFWNWDAKDTDLRLFQTGDKLTPASVTSVPAVAAASAPAAVPINETKVSAIGKLIKVILLTISFVIMILAVIYYVYKIDAEFVNKSGGGADGTASGGIAAQMNSPTAHTIYVIMAIVAVAGLVAYIRDKFTKTNAKTPENYLFDDLKTEDATNPLRQLAFGATHILYVILMIIVWIYDREIDEKNRLSITGMTVLGVAILFFHYGLEFIDTMNPTKQPPPSVRDIFTNIRFIINSVFFVILCVLAYYKQHGVMVVLILAMFIFHLTKSAIGIKLLHLLWLGIIYIPCLFLDFIQSSQLVVGDTTRPIWIIVAIEILLIAILYGGPYLLNYIGASASQMVAAPVTLKDKYDTNLNTQSPQIFIFHNTGIDRTPEDKAANCPAEEKKRYNYSISGWFLLNNNVTSSNKDLEIFNFGDVPKLTYNPSTSELKLYCNTLDMNGNPKNDSDLIYSSRTNYNSVISGKSDAKQQRLKMLLDNDDELDTPIPLQRWNYFVVNYDGKTMDFFLNTKLVVRSDFIMPDIQLKPITVGDGTVDIKTPANTYKGLNGSICNFAFHTTPLTKEQMRWTYNMLKTQNPPMVGMNTIEDEVKAAGSTTVYSK
jgi:hypothetical protein